MKKINRLLSFALPLAFATSLQAVELEFSGYMRAGIGANTAGGSQVCYGNGGVGHGVGRLGNECDTYAEIGIGAKLWEEEDRSFSVMTMISYGEYGEEFGTNGLTTPINDETMTNSGSDPSFGLAQFYGIGENVMGALPGADVWAGKRFYQRKDIHIMDLYYLNNSGYGAGIENIAVGSGFMSVAVLQDSQAFIGDDVTMPNSDYGDMKTNKLDIRYLMPFSDTSSIETAFIFGQPSLSTWQDDLLAGDPSNQINDATGYLINFEHALTFGNAGTFNKLALQYATEGFAYGMVNNHVGGAYNFKSIGYDYDNTGITGSSAFVDSGYRALNHGVVALGENIDISYALVYGVAETSNGLEDTKMNLVVRPVYKWNEIMSTAVEIGYEDREFNSPTAAQGGEVEAFDITKVTLAQQWSPLGAASGSFWARPQIRVFTSYYSGDDIVIEDADLMVGAQVEAFW